MSATSSNIAGPEKRGCSKTLCAMGRWVAKVFPTMSLKQLLLVTGPNSFFAGRALESRKKEVSHKWALEF